MKKLLFILALIFALVSCQNSRNRTIANELNRSFPMNTGAGITLMKAEALSGNVIKIHATITDPIFDMMDSIAVENMRIPMKNAMMTQLVQSRAMLEIDANIIYEFTTTGGRTFSIDISAEERKKASIDAETTFVVKSETMAVLNQIVSATKPSLPIVIDLENEISVIDIYVEGESTLVYVNEFPRENIISTDPEEMKSIMVGTLRYNQSIMNVIKSGIDLKYICKTPEGEELVQFIMTCSDFFEDC